MTPTELQRYGVRKGVLISREASKDFADYRDELGQTVELDGLVEEISGDQARVRVLLYLGKTGSGKSMLGVSSWIKAQELTPYEGINVWAERLVRKNLRVRNGEDVSEPRESPFWAPL
jgi:hypothetical protein